MLLSVQDLGYVLEGKEVFSHLSFTLQTKEILVLRGKNGSGKSTLLGILGGLLKPSCGVVQSSQKLEIGYLFQDSLDQFIAPIVLDDVAFSLQIRGVLDAKHQAMEMLEYLQIPHLANRSIYELSGGERRLVALAGVLVLECDLFLLDEPFNELDSEHFQRVVDLILQKEASFVLSDHGLFAWDNELIL